MVVKGSPSTDKRLCSCGCGHTIPKIDAYGIPRSFKNGHTWKGKTLPDKVRMKQRLAALERPRKEKISYWYLHRWVRKNLPKKEVCEICRSNTPRDVANISGGYRRDVADFMWLCQKCHKAFDKGRPKVGFRLH